MIETHTLTLQCEDRPGLVAAVATALASNGGNIVDAAQFNDRETGRFFMRVEFDIDGADALARFAQALGPCDIERRVLSEAVRLHLHDRVQLDGGRTVVFRT